MGAKTMNENLGQEREKLAERIRKLLRLANNNPSEREAIAAMERAYALMEEHNLTMAQVDAHGSGDERLQESFHGDYRGQTWARNIWAGVAELYFCMYAYMAAERVQRYRRTADGRMEKRPLREVDEHLIVGTRSNVESTKVMMEYLIATVERRAEQECYGAREQHAFKIGCADRLYDRLIKLRRERERASRQEQRSTSGNLPVLADVYTAHQAANEELYCKIHGRLPSGSGSKVVITPAPDGALRLRSGTNTHPHLLLPIGPGKPLNCTFARAGSIACQHQVNDDGLVLVLPAAIRLTANSSSSS